VKIVAVVAEINRSEKTMLAGTPKFLLYTIIVICLALALSGGAAWLVEESKSPADRISRLYSECSYGASSEVVKQQVTGERHNGTRSEVLKSDDNQIFVLKAYSYDGLNLSSNPIVNKCLAEDGKDRRIYLPLLQDFTSYGQSYSAEVANGNMPSEFHPVKINEELSGAIGLPIGANQYRYYAIYPSQFNQIEATYAVCSSAYSKYGNWSVDSNIGVLPTSDDVAMTDQQMHFIDNGKTLVLKINPIGLSSPYTNDSNLGRCVRGMLGMPERVRKDFEDDWWIKYANEGSGTKDANSTFRYSWGNFEMQVRHSDAYLDNDKYSKTEYVSEIMIYEK